MGHDGVLDVELAQVRELVGIAGRAKQSHAQFSVVVAMSVFRAIQECEANLAVRDIDPLLCRHFLSVLTFHGARVFAVLKPSRCGLSSQHTVMRTFHHIEGHIVPEGGVGHIDGEHGSQHGRVLVGCAIFHPTSINLIIDAWQRAVDIGQHPEAGIAPGEVCLNLGADGTILYCGLACSGRDVASAGAAVDGP